jgi:uncharacterized protein YegP (UPF0339 family)
MAEFEIYKDQDNPQEFRWRFRANNGEIIADSGEGYNRREDAEHAIEVMQTQAASGVGSFDIDEDEANPQDLRLRFRANTDMTLADPGGGSMSKEMRKEDVDRRIEVMEKQMVSARIREGASDIEDEVRAQSGTTYVERDAEDTASTTTSEQTSGTSSRRLNVVFSEPAYEELRELAKRNNKSVSLLVRDAIALQKWFDDTQRAGWRILAEKRGRVREIVKVR